MCIRMNECVLLWKCKLVTNALDYTFDFELSIVTCYTSIIQLSKVEFEWFKEKPLDKSIS